MVVPRFVATFIAHSKLRAPTFAIEVVKIEAFRQDNFMETFSLLNLELKPVIDPVPSDSYIAKIQQVMV